MRSQLRSTNAKIALASGAVLLLAVALWFLLVSPQRSKATRLDGQIASVQGELTARRAALAAPSAQVHLRASDLFRLTKAMPDQIDMAGIILSLNRLAKAHGLSFDSIQPGPAVVQTGFNVEPLSVVLQGRFSAVSGFLGDLRQLVRVHKRALQTNGRLFSVDQVDFAQADGKKKFPAVKATITVNAFTFVGTVPGTTPPTQSAPSAASGTVAAGATP